jgi:hypothetical protein
MKERIRKEQTSTDRQEENENSICALEWIGWALEAAQRHSQAQPEPAPRAPEPANKKRAGKKRKARADGNPRSVA